MDTRLDRLEAEHGGELPEITDPTPRERAQRLLDANAVPAVASQLDLKDAVYLQALANGRGDPHEPA